MVQNKEPPKEGLSQTTQTLIIVFSGITIVSIIGAVTYSCKNKKEPIKSMPDVYRYTIDKIRLLNTTDATRRGYLNALSVVLQALDPKLYHNQIEQIRFYIQEINNTTGEDNKLQLKSNSQSENWLQWSEVKKLWHKLNEEFSSLKKKRDISQDEYYWVQSFVIFSCYVHQAPRRTMDYSSLLLVDDTIEPLRNEADIRISDLLEHDEILKQNNFLLRDADKHLYFVFNRYKTAKTYGTQRFKLNYALKRIFIYWLKINRPRLKEWYWEHLDKPYELPAVFITRSGKTMSSQNIGTTLNSLFKEHTGKNISASMLRHIYISNYLRYGKTYKDRNDLAYKMAHSTDVQELVYRKIDEKVTFD